MVPKLYEPLKMAIVQRRPGPGVIHHSYQGIQYASGEYVVELKSHGFEISMSRGQAILFHISSMRSIIIRGFIRPLATAHRMTSRD